jgi:hypothetical protein
MLHDIVNPQTTYFSHHSWIVAFLQITFHLIVSIMYLLISLVTIYNFAYILSILLQLHSWKSPNEGLISTHNGQFLVLSLHHFFGVFYTADHED